MSAGGGHKLLLPAFSSSNIGSIDFLCLGKLTEKAAAQRPPSFVLTVVPRTRRAARSPVPSAVVSGYRPFRNSPMEARASARSRYSLRYTSSYFSVFTNDSQAALSQGLPLRDMLMRI